MESRIVVKNLWWVTRPTRDLRDLEEALRCFGVIAEGKQWRGNRNLQQRFEVENPAKTSHSGVHNSRGSGGRTWAAWLKSWGMWYDDERVTLTDAGRFIIKANDPNEVHKQIVHMIMMFQITSAYHSSLGHDPGFEIFPFRFMLKLLLNKDVRCLHLDEIGLFLLQIKKPSEYSSVVSRIQDWRKKTVDSEERRILKKRLISKHMDEYYVGRTDSPGTQDGYWRSVMDIANTFAVNISYISELYYNNKVGTVSIRNEDMNSAHELLMKYEHIKFSTLYKYSEATFMRKFGIQYNRRKSSRKDTAPMTPAKKQYRRISNAIADLRKEGHTSIDADLVEMIHHRTSDPIEVIKETISKYPDLSICQNEDEYGDFEYHYLDCGVDGERHREFEVLTRKIFEMMGFSTKKMKIPKSSRRFPEVDGVILNKKVGLSGLLECKSGEKYTFPIGDCEKMKHTYIKHFKTKRIDGRRYDLDFFVYVVGKSTSGLDNFREITQDTGIRGSVIYARELIKIYKMFKDGNATQIKIWNLLKSNKHIDETDVMNAF